MENMANYVNNATKIKLIIYKVLMLVAAFLFCRFIIDLFDSQHINIINVVVFRLIYSLILIDSKSIARLLVF